MSPKRKNAENISVLDKDVKKSKSYEGGFSDFLSSETYTNESGNNLLGSIITSIASISSLSNVFNDQELKNYESTDNAVNDSGGEIILYLKEILKRMDSSNLKTTSNDIFRDEGRGGRRSSSHIEDIVKITNKSREYTSTFVKDVNKIIDRIQKDVITAGVRPKEAKEEEKDEKTGAKKDNKKEEGFDITKAISSSLMGENYTSEFIKKKISNIRKDMSEKIAESITSSVSSVKNKVLNIFKSDKESVVENLGEGAGSGGFSYDNLELKTPQQKESEKPISLGKISEPKEEKKVISVVEANKNIEPVQPHKKETVDQSFNNKTLETRSDPSTRLTSTPKSESILPLTQETLKNVVSEAVKKSSEIGVPTVPVAGTNASTAGTNAQGVPTVPVASTNTPPVAGTNAQGREIRGNDNVENISKEKTRGVSEEEKPDLENVSLVSEEKDGSRIVEYLEYLKDIKEGVDNLNESEISLKEGQEEGLKNSSDILKHMELIESYIGMLKEEVKSQKKSRLFKYSDGDNKTAGGILPSLEGKDEKSGGKGEDGEEDGFLSSLVKGKIGGFLKKKGLGMLSKVGTGASSMGGSLMSGLGGIGSAMTGGIGLTGLLGTSVTGIGGLGAGAVATSVGLAGLAGAAGYGVGHAINKKFIEPAAQEKMLKEEKEKGKKSLEETQGKINTERESNLNKSGGTLERIKAELGSDFQVEDEDLKMLTKADGKLLETDFKNYVKAIKDTGNKSLTVNEAIDLYGGLGKFAKEGAEIPKEKLDKIKKSGGSIEKANVGEKSINKKTVVVETKSSAIEKPLSFPQKKTNRVAENLPSSVVEPSVSTKDSDKTVGEESLSSDVKVGTKSDNKDVKSDYTSKDTKDFSGASEYYNKKVENLTTALGIGKVNDLTKQTVPKLSNKYEDSKTVGSESVYTKNISDGGDKGKTVSVESESNIKVPNKTTSGGDFSPVGGGKQQNDVLIHFLKNEFLPAMAGVAAGKDTPSPPPVVKVDLGSYRKFDDLRKDVMAGSLR